LAALLTGACGRPDAARDASTADAPDTFMLYDSAGITLAVTAPTAALEQWRIGRTPEFRIGASDGPPEALLYRVREPVQLAAGGIALLNAGTNEVRVYDGRGRFVRAAGRTGAGPGEYRLPLMLHPLPGDSLAVYDYMARRITILDAELNVGRTVTPVAVQGARGMVGHDAIIAAAPAAPPRDREGLHPTPMVVLRVEPASGRQDTVVVAGGRQEYQWLAGERVLSTPVPFTTHAQLAVAGDRVYVADGTSPGYHIYDAAGRLLRVVRLAVEPVPVTQQEFDAALRRIGDAAEPPLRARARDVAGRLPRPAVRPFFDAISVSDDGAVWLRHFEPQPDAEYRTWSVFDEQGRRIAEFAAPAALRIRIVGRDHVIVHLEDELGIEYVQRYRIVRS
jgi:hypothetical protein